MSTPSPIWNLNKAANFCQWLEKLMLPLGLHVAVGGSVLMKGESSKDLDVFLYPHRRDKRPSAAVVFQKLLDLGFTYNRGEESSTLSCPAMDKTLCVLYTPRRKLRVDFFFLFADM